VLEIGYASFRFILIPRVQDRPERLKSFEDNGHEEASNNPNGAVLFFKFNYYLESKVVFGSSPPSSLHRPLSSFTSSPQAVMGGTKPMGRSKNSLPVASGGIVRIQNTTLLIIAVIFSVCFILALSCAFLGDDEDEPYFKSILDEVAQTNPGVSVLNHQIRKLVP
jgi:hypothetical protein